MNNQIMNHNENREIDAIIKNLVENEELRHLYETALKMDKAQLAALTAGAEVMTRKSTDAEIVKAVNRVLAVTGHELLRAV